MGKGIEIDGPGETQWEGNSTQLENFQINQSFNFWGRGCSRRFLKISLAAFWPIQNSERFVSFCVKSFNSPRFHLPAFCFSFRFNFCFGLFDFFYSSSLPLSSISLSFVPFTFLLSFSQLKSASVSCKNFLLPPTFLHRFLFSQPRNFFFLLLPSIFSLVPRKYDPFLGVGLRESSIVAFFRYFYSSPPIFNWSVFIFNNFLHRSQNFPQRFCALLVYFNPSCEIIISTLRTEQKRLIFDDSASKPSKNFLFLIFNLVSDFSIWPEREKRKSGVEEWPTRTIRKTT